MRFRRVILALGYLDRPITVFLWLLVDRLGRGNRHHRRIVLWVGPLHAGLFEGLLRFGVFVQVVNGFLYLVKELGVLLFRWRLLKRRSSDGWDAELS